MTSFLFLISEYQELRSYDIKDSVRNSQNTPMFVMFYTKYSYKCRGVYDKFKKFGDMITDQTNILVTPIDCGNTRFCEDNKIRGFPKYALIKSENPQYWIYTHERDPIGWMNFIAYETGYHVVEVGTDFNVESMVQSGGPFFNLQINKSHHDLLLEYKKISRNHRTFGSIFSYTYGNYTKPKLTAYYAKDCTKQIDAKIDNMLALVTEEKFSAFHHYKYQEFQSFSSGLFILYVTKDLKRSDTYNQISKLTRKQSCKSARYGWASLITDRWVSEIVNMTQISEPYFAVINADRSCAGYSIGNANHLLRTHLISDISQGKKCLPYGEIVSTNKIVPTNAMFVVLLVIVFSLGILYYFMNSVFELKPKKDKMTKKPKITSYKDWMLKKKPNPIYMF